MAKFVLLHSAMVAAGMANEIWVNPDWVITGTQALVRSGPPIVHLQMQGDNVARVYGVLSEIMKSFNDSSL